MKNILIIVALIIACGSEAYPQSNIFGWGHNNFGQLGFGTTLNKNIPKQIDEDSSWIKIGCGDGHTAAIKRNGTLWTWGWNYFGQLGDGTTADKLTPVQVGTDNHWLSVSCGGSFTAAIKNDNTLWVWGKVNQNLFDGVKILLMNIVMRKNPVIKIATPATVSMPKSHEYGPEAWISEYELRIITVLPAYLSMFFAPVVLLARLLSRVARESISSGLASDSLDSAENAAPSTWRGI